MRNKGENRSFNIPTKPMRRDCMAGGSNCNSAELATVTGTRSRLVGLCAITEMTGTSVPWGGPQVVVPVGAQSPGRRLLRERYNMNTLLSVHFASLW